MRKTVLTLSIVGVSLSILASCAEQFGRSEEMPTRSDGAAFFAQNCSACHGNDGQGNGPEAGSLASQPINLTTLSATNNGEFPAARALSYIYGDPENGHLARVMPQFGGAMADDLVPVEIDGVLTPTPRELASLLVYLESIQQ